MFPISWIVFWAIALYQVTVETGKFRIIKSSMGNLTSDARLQALLIAFAFGAFVEGAGRFWIPRCSCRRHAGWPRLLSLFFDAAALCLVANTAPVAFGSIGIPVVTLAGITGLPLDKLSGAVGRLCAPLSLFVPCYLVCIMVGWRGMLEVWPAVVVVGGVFASAQFLMSNYVGPQLTDIMASLCALGALLLLLRFGAQPRCGIENWSRLFRREKRKNFLPSPRPAETCHGPNPWRLDTLRLACNPVLLWGFKPFQALLNSATISFGWPLLHNHVLMMPPAVARPTLYKAVYQLNFLTASGTACMFATLLSAGLLRMSPAAFGRLLLSVCRQLFLPTLTVAAVLAMAFVMNYSGPPPPWARICRIRQALSFLQPAARLDGRFPDRLDTSANALFGNLQVVTAGRLGFDPTLMAAANTVGGVVGKMISVQNIAVAAAATAMTVADQARLFRFTLRHSMVMATAIAVEVMLYAYLFHQTH